MAVRSRRGGVHPPPSNLKYYNGCTEEQGGGYTPSLSGSITMAVRRRRGGYTPPLTGSITMVVRRRRGGVHPPLLTGSITMAVRRRRGGTPPPPSNWKYYNG